MDWVTVNCLVYVKSAIRRQNILFYLTVCIASYSKRFAWRKSHFVRSYSSLPWAGVRECIAANSLATLKEGVGNISRPVADTRRSFLSWADRKWQSTIVKQSTFCWINISSQFCSPHNYLLNRSWGVKRQGRKSDDTSQSCVEFKNNWSSTPALSTCLHAL
jgi:hypothetical protein